MQRSFCIMAPLAFLLVLALTACATAPTPTTAPTTKPSDAASAKERAEAKPAGDKPQYGGTLRLSLSQDVSYFDDYYQGGPMNRHYVQGEELWGGDWTKGNAGGYGTNETDWTANGYDIFDHKVAWLAESWKVDVDNQTQQATVVYKIRPGVRYAINPASEVGKKIGGREVTADDVVASLTQQSKDSRGYLFRGNPELRTAEIIKTGPMEVTVKVPLSDLVTALSRMSDQVRIYPKEIYEQKIDGADWKNQVGTGAFMLSNYVAGSSLSLAKNPNYWLKDPIGPGKGNQLPYLDGVEYLIIPDVATRLAAFRTGKIDHVDGLTWEDSDQIKKEFPKMQSAEGEYYAMWPMYIRTDRAPYNDIRVRRALMMATDFNTIKQSYNGGRGILTAWPFELYKEYKDLYVSPDDPDVPASVKELYTYSPDKAKKLLAEAGFPNGFKTSILCRAPEVSYYEMIAGMWQKVGVELAIDVKDPATQQNLVNTMAFDHMTSGPGKGPVAIYYSGYSLQGAPGFTNPSVIDDPVIKEMLPKIRLLASTDQKESFKLTREMVKYVYDQAYAIPRPSYRTTIFWWPWIKNYSGENSVGYYNMGNWAMFVWLDQDLKKSMGF